MMNPWETLLDSLFLPMQAKGLLCFVKFIGLVISQFGKNKTSADFHLTYQINTTQYSGTEKIHPKLSTVVSANVPQLSPYAQRGMLPPTFPHHSVYSSCSCMIFFRLVVLAQPCFVLYPDFSGSSARAYFGITLSNRTIPSQDLSATSVPMAVNLLNSRSDSLGFPFAHIDRQPLLVLETSVSILFSSRRSKRLYVTVSHNTKARHSKRSQQG